MKPRTRIILLSVISILIVVTIVLGVTYSFMQANIDSSSVTEVSLSSCANITLIDSGESIDLNNSYPMSRDRALQTIPYTFTVTSTCPNRLGFNIYVAPLNSNTLDASNIHYIITEHNNIKNILNEGILSETTNGLNDFQDYELNELNNGINGTYGSIYKIYSNGLHDSDLTYDLYLYIDESATNETMGQTFNAGIAVKTFDYNFPTINSVTTSDITDSSVTVTVDATAGDNSISNYYFSIDGRTYINNGNNNVYTFTDLEAETEYNISVYVTDTLNYNSQNYNLNATTEASSELVLDISLGNIVINEGSSSNTLYVSGGGLSEQIEINSTFPIIITGTTEAYGIEVYGGTSNITLSNVSIKSSHVCEVGGMCGPILLENDAVVNLTIEGENDIEASEIEFSQIFRSSVGIYVPSSSTLVIGGDGILNVKGNSSGIGSGSGGSAGSIIINSGTINAKGDGRGAGIGGYGLVLVEINGGNVTAIGGNVNSTDDGGGAGIGGTIDAFITGEIRINGGTVYAQGGMLAAGIGGGGMAPNYCGTQSTAPNIYIFDSANVTAMAGGVYTEFDIPAENIGKGGFSC